MEVNLKFCRNFEEEHEKHNFCRHLKSKKNLPKSGIKSECRNCNKIFDTQEKSHKCQPNNLNEIECEDCKNNNNEIFLEKHLINIPINVTRKILVPSVAVLFENFVKEK